MLAIPGVCCRPDATVSGRRMDATIAVYQSYGNTPCIPVRRSLPQVGMRRALPQGALRSATAHAVWAVGYQHMPWA